MGKKGAARSSETGRSYRLDRLIGQGGFGEVYLATPTPQGGLPSQVCIKISHRLTAWLREAYCAGLLEQEPRALRVFDRFAEVDGDGMRYCMVMEYAEHGDVGAWLKQRGPQPERFVRREIAALLGPLDTLQRGDITSPMRSKDVRRLPCSDHLKEVIHRCLGSRGRRYEAAGELIAALRHRPKELKQGRVQSLAGKRLSITGFLRRPRSDAIAAARKAGAIIQSKPGLTTDVLVRGRPNQLQIAGEDGGTKLMEIRRLAALGHRITIIGEQQFWKLAASKT